ncbi:MULTISPECIES: hypothetical protein [unclassified Caulobacter]|uniref:hypothetical protein n=1 Tax=unclassified Caulobacter TaxID=2648921 RepID=UPI000D369148|nr:MULTISPECIES: hypothetical protein [unclassified Caulobacter]
MYHTLTPWISLGVATLVCGFAIWKGDRWTRFVGGIFLGGWILSPFVATTDSLQPEWGVMVIDVIALLLFIWASLKARKLWTVFAAACQMMAVASHIISIIDLRIYMATVIVGLALLSYGVLIALLFGTASAIRARRGRRANVPDSGS